MEKQVQSPTKTSSSRVNVCQTPPKFKKQYSPVVDRKSSKDSKITRQMKANKTQAPQIYTWQQTQLTQVFQSGNLLLHQPSYSNYCVSQLGRN